MAAGRPPTTKAGLRRIPGNRPPLKNHLSFVKLMRLNAPH